MLKLSNSTGSIRLLGLFSLFVVGAGVFYATRIYIPHLKRSDVPQIPDIPLTGMYDPTKTEGEFHGTKVKIPPEPKLAMADTNVLGKNTDKKRIEINLSKQKLYAYEGDKKVYSFLISSGKWGRTPTGEYRIWTKLKSTLMAGGSTALGTYYYLPNVPYTMYFHGGYGIHGTYWHDNFGHPMSHGCINMKTEEAEKLFYWANPVLSDGQHSVSSSEDNPGTRVIIYGEAPWD